MFYEYQCCIKFTVRKRMSEAWEPEVCPKCGAMGKRIFSTLQINMQRMVGEGLTRTNEPPDELKPGIERNIREREQGVLKSYPGKPAKRLPCFE